MDYVWIIKHKSNLDERCVGSGVKGDSCYDTRVANRACQSRRSGGFLSTNCYDVNGDQVSWGLDHIWKPFIQPTCSLISISVFPEDHAQHHAVDFYGIISCCIICHLFCQGVLGNVATEGNQFCSRILEQLAGQSYSRSFTSPFTSLMTKLKLDASAWSLMRW